MSKKYVRPWPTTSWWTRRPGYFMFMVRELTAVFVAVYLVMLLVVLSKLGKGPETFIPLLDELRHPGWRILHGLALVAALWHAVTWFNLTPKAMPVFLGDKKAPGALVAIGMGYAPWVVVSILILWLTCP